MRLCKKRDCREEAVASLMYCQIHMSVERDKVRKMCSIGHRKAAAKPAAKKPAKRAPR